MTIYTNTKQYLFLSIIFLTSLLQGYTRDEVVIDKKAEQQSFFDTVTLAELAKLDREDQIDDTANKLNDFFISSGIHFESKDRFATLKKGYYSNTFIIPKELERKTPIFLVEMPATQMFYRAYLKFLADSVNKMQRQVAAVYAQIQDQRSLDAAVNFSQFYACLRTISVTASGDMHNFPCLPATIQALHLRDESTVTELANTYMSLYRASRISIVSPEKIDIKDENILKACRSFRDPLIRIQMATSQMIFLKQPTPSMFGSRSAREWESAVALYYMSPKVTDLLGPYVSVSGDYEPSLMKETLQLRLCRF